MEKSFIEHSKAAWHKKEGNNKYPGDNEIIIGCLQRIAIAQEKIASNYDKNLRKENEYLSERVKRQNASIEYLNKSNSALRGHFKRVKKKLNPPTNAKEKKKKD